MAERHQFLVGVAAFTIHRRNGMLRTVAQTLSTLLEGFDEVWGGRRLGDGLERLLDVFVGICMRLVAVQEVPQLHCIRHELQITIEVRSLLEAVCLLAALFVRIATECSIGGIVVGHYAVKIDIDDARHLGPIEFFQLADGLRCAGMDDGGAACIDPFGAVLGVVVDQNIALLAELLFVLWVCNDVDVRPGHVQVLFYPVNLVLERVL